MLFVSTLFFAGTIGIFEWTEAHGASIAEARTWAANTLVVMEVFYLFSVRFLRSTSLTLRGARGTPPVLIAIGAVILLQGFFTYAPVMETLFDTRPLPLGHVPVVLGIGVAVFVILEIEKALRRAFAPAPAPAEGDRA